MCHLVNMHRSGQWNITIGSTKKNHWQAHYCKRYHRGRVIKDFDFTKRFVFFYHREGFKSGFIFIKRPTRNSVNDLDDEIGVLIKKNRAFNTENGSQILFLSNSR